MDPLSVAASTVAFIGVCRQLATCLKFLRDTSRAPDEALALTDELNGLQNVLTAVGLVARERRDDVLTVLLTPLFTKADQIIQELCDVCGASFQRLQQDDNYSEQLKLQLRARFKWARAKNRVGELRENLKVLRLDFANSLAAIGLLDISRLTSELKTLSTEISNKNQGQLQIDSMILPRYYRGSMQNSVATDLEKANLEAERPHMSSPKSSLRAEGQALRRYDLNTTACKPACSCACHSVFRIKTPPVLQNFLGSLLIKSNGLYGLNQSCNEFSCRRPRSANVNISYRFPQWLLSRMVSSIITSNALSGPQLSLVTPRVVSNTADIFSYACAGNLDGVAKLFELGLASPYDVNDTFGYTPLHYAADKGHMGLCRFLLSAGARPEIIDFEENSVVDLAWNKICLNKVSSKDAAELEEIFKSDAWFEERQFSVLHKIVLGLLPAHRSLEQELSTSTSNIELADSEGRTPLSWASERGNAAAVRTLLNHGANISTKSSMGMTPLHYAAKAPTPACVLVLLGKGACVTAKNKWNQSPLNIASFFQDAPLYILPFLDHGADIDERDCYGSSALNCAIFMDNMRTAECLISNGADINSQDGHCATSLNNSIAENSHNCIPVLLDSGADLLIADHKGETALHLLARHADRRTIEIFQATDLEELDPEAGNNVGLTPWDLMRRRVDVTEDVEDAFRSLMTRLDPKSHCVDYVDALERLPPVMAKIPDVIEVKIEEMVEE